LKYNEWDVVTPGTSVRTMTLCQEFDAVALSPAFAVGSFWRRSPFVLAITGTVPTPGLRDAVMRLVVEELSRRQPGARAEDRLVVDPLMLKQRARTL